MSEQLYRQEIAADLEEISLCQIYETAKKNNEQIRLGMDVHSLAVLQKDSHPQELYKRDERAPDNKMDSSERLQSLSLLTGHLHIIPPDSIHGC